MNCIGSQVSRESAWRTLHRRRHRWFVRLAGWVVRKRIDHYDEPTAGDQGPMLEMVRLPFYRVRFPLIKDGHQGAFEILVGGHDAAVVRVTGGLELETAVEHDLFTPTVSAEQAVEIARGQLTLARVREPGWRNQDFDIGKPEVEPLQYPLWAYYYEPRKGILDVLLLDAVTGKLVGSRTKVAFLTAITAATKT